MSGKLKLILPVVIVLGGGLVTAILVRTKPEVETRESPALAPLVRVVTAQPRDIRLDVTAQGTVLPRTETTLVAQVAGEVVEVAADFEAGGFFLQGEVMVTLDPRDFALAVKRREAQVAQAEVLLTREEAEAEVAAVEWEELGTGEPSPLVLRQPQVAEARAALAAAEAELEKARLDLERTRIRAPFDCRVRRKEVDRGRYLTPGQPVAAIHGVDFAEVRLPVPDDQLAYLDLPFAYRNRDSAASGPAVTLRASFAGGQHSWQGRIVRTEGEVDPKSRMLNLVARVERPYDRGSDAAAGRPPLVVGLFVQAQIAGQPAEDVFVLPRSALRDGDRVLIVDDEDRLRFRTVEVLRTAAGNAIVSGGIEAGAQVCISPLDVAVDGMEVRTATAAEGGTVSVEEEAL